jgi:uncharacterized protein YceK
MSVRANLHAAAALVVTGLAVLTPGCAAVMNDLYSQRAYGGVQFDAELVADLSRKGNDLWPAEGIVCLDLPLSAAVDTVSLPLTLPVTIGESLDTHRQ